MSYLEAIIVTLLYAAAVWFKVEYLAQDPSRAILSTTALVVILLIVFGYRKGEFRKRNYIKKG